MDQIRIRKIDSESLLEKYIYKFKTKLEEEKGRGTSEGAMNGSEKMVW